LLDVVLQLIIFFILVSQIGVEERPDLTLPSLQDPQVQRTGQSQRLLVNILAAPSAIARDAARDPAPPAAVSAIKLGATSYDPRRLDALTEALATGIEKDPRLQVLVRADAALPYDAVAPVLQAIRTAGIKDVGLVALARELSPHP
jgi:biopolymer transport protein ExbD